MALSDHPMWRKPKHHADLDHVHDHVHWTELFYDLIHVVSIFLLGNYLADHFDLAGFMVFAGVFVTLWYAWGELSIFNSIYVSTDFWHRLIMSVMIITVMFMAAAITDITQGGWAYFAIGFSANRVMIAMLYLRVWLSDCDSKDLCYEQIRNFLFFSVVFGLTAFMPKPMAFWAF